MDRPAFVPDNDQTFAGYFRDKVITRLWNLTLVSNQHPLPGKNLLLFLRKNFRRNKVTLRERLCSSLERLGRLTKCFFCLGGRHFGKLHPAYVPVNGVVEALVFKRLRTVETRFLCQH